ncbi:hypothetical protein ACWEWG_12590 [Streptomyces sp. NPDC003758]|uniref:Uncharacterized protein n=2 Tax=Streptomyces TaxID=1883 RepID=A0ABY6DYM9_9ACTN|nr:hypothetical protein [Streptomyces cynarae]UXY19509.1 hypothetical protein N8I84_12810 [Streptomyces cynarae]
MNDTSTTQPLSAEAQEIPGHGKHRGPVSAEDHEAAPHGRHRKPSGQQQQTGTAARTASAA